MIAKAKDEPVTLPDRKETSRVWVYFQASCGQCEWRCSDRRQMESDSWADLTTHLRSSHGGNIREVRIRRTVIEELAEPELGDSR